MTTTAEGIIRLALSGDRNTSNLLTWLQPEWVTTEKEKAIVQTIVDLSITGRPVTATTISTRVSGLIGKQLARELFGSKSGVSTYLDAVMSGPIPDVGMQSLADQIKLEHTTEIIKRSALEVIGSLDEYTSAEEASTKAIEIMAGAIDGSIGDSGAIDAYKLTTEWVMAKGKELPRWGMDWIFPTWNRYCRLRAGQIAVFAAPTGVGKSWFGPGMMEKACEAGGRVALFTGEMTAEEILERMMKGGGFNDAQVDADEIAPEVMRRAEKLADMDFVIHEGRITIERIQAAVVRARAIGKPYNLVIVDHIHLMSFDNSNYRLALNDAMSSFKGDIAQREKCAIILLAQLRRPESGGVHRRPRLTDIKESSAIEQIADYVFLMAHENEDDEDSNRSIVWNDKRRSGKRMRVITVDIDARMNRLVEVTDMPIGPSVAELRASLVE